MENIYKSKYFATLLLLISTVALFAQIPNPGFETWTSGSCDLGAFSYNDPTGWGSINVLTCPGGGFTCLEANSGSAHSGSHALELTTVSIFGQTAPGIIATGVINQTTQNVDGGFAISTRYDKLIGWYKYAPAPPDTFQISVDIYSGTTTGAIIGAGSLSGSTTVSSYAKFIVDIPYTSGATPDSAKITILSSPGANGTAGTVMYVDDISFVSCTGFGATATPVNASCTSATGSITLATPVNGTGPYVYNWSNGSTATSISNLSPGTYKITITDDNTCRSIDSIVISGANVPFTVTATGSVTSCSSNTGTVTVSASAGNSPYTYLWSNSNTTTQITGLGAGNYPVTVTDAHGCTTTASGSVTTPNGPTATETSANLTCNNDSTGAITVVVAGGTAPITYNWSNNSTSLNLTHLGVGNYTLTITDQNNCSFEVSATITQPAAILATGSNYTVSCYGDSTGTLSVQASGGTPPYTYAWSTSAVDTSTISNLAAGNYSVIVLDHSGCLAYDSFQVTQPTRVSATVTTTNASSATASDGSAFAVASGGTGQLTFSWNTSSTHDTITHLSPAVYCVTVTDANFCSASACDSVGYSVGINTISSALIRIYPNPASNQLTIETNKIEGSFFFAVYSLEGRMVEQKIVTGEKSTIMLSQLSDGFYTYQLRDEANGSMNYGKLEILK